MVDATPTSFSVPDVGWTSSPRWSALRRLLRHRLGAFGLIVCAGVAVMALFASVLAPFDPATSYYDAILSPPSWHYLFGTDELGRDVLSRIIYGAQVSLQITAVAIVSAVIAGSLLGTLSGYIGGWVDDAIMRICDGMLAFPMLVLALGIIAVLGPGITNAMIAIMIVNIPSVARLVRAQVLTVRQLDFVIAAEALGASDVRIMVRHIWPSVVGDVIVYASLRASAALITESSLAFLGLGAQPPTPSWGQMLASAMQYWDAWWLSLFPGLAIFITVLALNFLGDGLRDLLDTRLDA
jgi:peptide/nickel transport system permease protein